MRRHLLAFVFRIVLLVVTFAGVSSAQAFASFGEGYAPAGWQAQSLVIARPYDPNAAHPSTGFAQVPYSPASILGAYGINALLLGNTTGAGVTIAVVEPYGDIDSSGVEHIQSDLQTFSSMYGLPYSGPSTATPTLTVAQPYGSPTTNNTSWAVEVALDVEWVHAIAPGANILLVEAPNNGAILFDAAQYASQHASIVSMSWGGPEFSGETNLDIYCLSGTNVAFLAATGDSGAGVLYPSTSQNVTAVGGTSLTVDSSNSWYWESGWSGSGGGNSAYESYVPFQSPWISSGNRSVPDVSAVADPNTGVAVYCQGAWYQAGGTGLSVSLWAGLIGLANGNRTYPMGYLELQQVLYFWGSPPMFGTYFHDIATGSNGYTASLGYDNVTGIGTPVANALIPALRDTTPTISGVSPAGGQIGTSVTINGTGLSAASVEFNGTPAYLSSDTRSQIVAIVPNGATTGPITVQTSAGIVTTAISFVIGTTVPAPTITPNGGTSTVGQMVRISDQLSTAAIYYTLDGSTPTTSSKLYTGPFALQGIETVKAIGVQAGWTTSAVATASFTVPLYPVVTNLGDSNVAGSGSLRDAINYANANPGSTITFLSGLTGTISVNTVLPTLTAAVNIQGPGASVIAIDGGGVCSPLKAAPPSGSTVALSGLTLQHGYVAILPASGMITATSGSLSLTNCIFANNSGYFGGAVFANGSTVTVTGSTFTGNISRSFGGAVFSVNALTLTNCTFYGNSSGSDGGAVSGGNPIKVVGCTFTGNASARTCGAVYGGATIVNSILWGDSSANNTEALTTAYNSDVQGAASASSHTISVDPQLSPLAYNGGPTPTMALAATSPCFWGGTTSLSFVTFPTTDQRGVTRPNPPSMGAYDISVMPAPVISPAAEPVSSTQPASVVISDPCPTATIYYTLDGSTPTTASFQYSGPFSVSTTQTVTALAHQTGYTDSALASVTYTQPTSSTVSSLADSGVGSLRYALVYANANSGSTITFANGLTGTITLASPLPQIVMPLTIVGPGPSVLAIDGAGSYRAFSANVGGGIVNISGLTIQNCNGTNSSLYAQYGGAILALGGNVTLSNCVLTGNTAKSYGGAIYSTGGLLALFSCTFSSNSAYQGGALCLGGGGIYATGSTFVSNSSGGVGGCLYTFPSTSTGLINCTLTGNLGYQGGAIYALGPVSTVSCTIAGNTASSWGAAIYTAAPVTLSDCIVVGNTSSDNQQFYINTSGAVTATYCDIAGGYAGTGNISANPLLGALASNGGLTQTMALAQASPCYGAGTSAGAPATDQRGVTRPNPPSIGAYDDLVTPLPSISPNGATFTSTQSVSVTLADANPNATIHYTTDGSTPTASSPVYSGPIAVSTAQTVTAFAQITGYADSVVVSAAFTPVTPAPTISPNGGTFTSGASTTVTISDSISTPLYYTLDGTTPTSASTLYTGPFSVSTNCVVSAAAIPSGLPVSAVTSATFAGTTPPPVISVAGGGVVLGQTTSATITDASPGASVYYTLDGSAPTTASNLYSGPVTISSPCTVSAIAVLSGFPTSAIASTAVQGITPAPTIAPSGGVLVVGQQIALSDPFGSATILYSSDNTLPLANWTTYSAPFAVPSSGTVYAVAVSSGNLQSAQSAATFDVVDPAPAISPSGGIVPSGQLVTLSDDVSGANIYYTTDGSTPQSATATLYTRPFAVTAGETVNAAALGPLGDWSAVTSATFQIRPTSLAAPVIAPSGGSVVYGQSVALSDTSLGAVVYYTVDGSTPSSSSTLYSGPITVTSPTAVKAIAIEAGVPDSPVTASVFTIMSPSIASLSPTGAAFASAPVTLTVNGNGFSPYATVNLGGVPLATAYVSQTQLTATIPTASMNVPGPLAVTVSNPAPGGATSNSRAFLVAYPVPAVSTITPSSVQAGTPAFTLTVNGSGFVSSSTAYWKSTALATTYVSANQLTATMPATLIANNGLATINVRQPDGTWASATATLTVTDATPIIASLSPALRGAGSGAFTLTVNGSAFLSGAVVQWGGIALSTTFVSASQLTATVPGGRIATQGNVAVTVVQPDGTTSSATSFTVTAPVPGLTTLVPSSKPSGNATFVLTVNGASFQTGATILWNGSPLATTFVAATQLTTVVSNTLVASPASVPVNVRQPDGTLAVSALTFTVTDPIPVIASFNPRSAPAGSAPLTITVNGSGYMPGAAVVFNTTPLATTFVNSGQLTAVLPDTSMASPLTASISVVQADGTSYKAAAGFTVTNAIPVVSSISPALVHANAGAFTLTVNGSNFVSGAAVFWKSVALATTFVNSTQLTAQVPNGYIASAGAATITVKQPDSVPSTTSCTLTITQPLATVTSISPTTKPAASGAFTLTVMGTQFMTASTVQWNGVALATTFVSATQLTASVPGGRIATPGAIPVTVVQSDGTASTPAVFTVSDPIPALTGLVPSSKPHGNATFVIIVNGTQFLSGATVLWNGAPLATSFVATTQVTATVPAALVTSAGTATITLQQPDGTPATASLTFTVN